MFIHTCTNKYISEEISKSDLETGKLPLLASFYSDPVASPLQHLWPSLGTRVDWKLLYKVKVPGIFETFETAETSTASSAK